MGPRKEDGSQEWKVVLEREIDSQPGMAGARKHPISVEKDIYNIFCVMRIQLKEEEKHGKIKSGLDGADEGSVSARRSALREVKRAALQAFCSIV